MPDTSLAALALRLAVSMGVVIALMVLAAKVLKRAQAYAATSGRTASGSGRSHAGRAGRHAPKVTRLPIEVQTIAPLGRGASVALVRAAGRELVVGITEQHVTLLHAGPEPIELDPDQALEADRWDAALSELTDPELTDPELTELDEAADDADLTPSPGAARIAALVPTSPGGSSAWTVALETLRARTVRR